MVLNRFSGAGHGRFILAIGDNLSLPIYNVWRYQSMKAFIKRNSTSFDDALEKEAQGLCLLRSEIKKGQITELAVPQIISVNKRELRIESIAQGSAKPEQMEALGRGLAKLHQLKFDQFGLDDNNYIGLNPQKNGFSDSWGDFFIRQRLGVQVSFVKDPSLKAEFESTLQAAYSPLCTFLNGSSPYPSLVHGDLWSGNVLFDATRVWLIDPAVYYADREVDIAMTEMFGGFTQPFYQAYQESFPLSDDYPIKKKIYNLYHYLNHYNLFGDGYLSACQRTMALIRSLG